MIRHCWSHYYFISSFPFRQKTTDQFVEPIALNLIANHECPDVCTVIIIATMVWSKAKLRHSNKLPLTICKNKGSQIRYMTHQKVTNIIRKVVKAVCPNMPKETLSKYSCHSIRVWVCVCLDEVGKQPDFIKKRVIWAGESYRVYLGDANKINEQHRDALKASFEATMALLSRA